MTTHTEEGQVMVFVALVLPMLLLPVVAFAVDSAAAAGAHARLEEATATAVELAVQQIDVDALRSGAGVALDAATVQETVRQHMAVDEPDVTIESVSISGLTLTVFASKPVDLPFNFLGAPRVVLHAQATARLAVGYESPSSFLPFSVSTFCREAGGMSSCSSSSRQRWG